MPKKIENTINVNSFLQYCIVIYVFLKKKKKHPDLLN